MTDKIKLRLTITMEYEAKPEHYQEEDRTPERMAMVDANNFDDGLLLEEHLSFYPYTVTVVPVTA